MNKFPKNIWKATLASLMAAAVLFGAVLWIYSAVQNKTILTTSYTVTHPQIPASFEGKRIVQVTDLHNADFGDQLTDLVKSQAPDIIVATGDWITKDDEDIAPAKAQMKALTTIAPVFYVAGNHEAWSPLCADLLIYLEDIGVTVLESRAVDWTVGNDSVQLVGMFDSEFGTYLHRDVKPNIDEERYSILLFHRPEYFSQAVACGVDLVLCGHTHGGQIRLPLIGSLFAPGQGWFPEYDVGEFTMGESTMILSQGLGIGTATRILTPPEICVITLDSPHV